jgi:integrase
MAIYPMLKTVSFSPEDVERLATAYEDALRALRVVNRADPITVVIAKRIIDAAQAGMRDPKELCALAINDLQTPGIHSEKGAR